MNVITGDLLRLALDARFDVIVHGCNCQCAMGKGIALSIKQQFPEAYDADLRTPKGDRAKLGTISTAEIERPPALFTVVNAYTQFHWRGEGVLADYDAIRSAFRLVGQRFTAAGSATRRSAPAWPKATGRPSRPSSTKNCPARTTRW